MRHPKKAILATTLAIVGLLPIVSNAWGPGRTTFTIEKPADYVVFNSITNNPAHGDERNFVQIKEAGASNNTYADKLNIVAGKTYTVYVYYHNNAAANLNLVATNTRMNTQLPSTVKANTETAISAKIMADNANPKTVWDEAKVTAKENVVLKYVSGSATIYSKGAVNGQKLNSNEFLTSGALIGYNALDGRVQGCHQFTGYVTYDFVVEAANKPNFTIAKTVSLSGKKAYGENVNTTDNQTVDFKLIYTNTGNTKQTGVIIKDVLPTGLTYVKGSTKLSNQSTGGKWQSVSDNIGTTGINIGDYAAGGNAYIMFSAKINDFDCGKQVEITNYAQAITKDGTKQDSAKVIVKTEACPIKDIQVCDLTSKKVITIKENSFDATKHSKNLKDCEATPVVKDIKVCQLSDKKIVTIKETAFDASKHSKDLTKCDPVTPVKSITVCRLSDKKMVSILENQFDANKYSKNAKDCETLPTPSELPTTGPAETLSQVIGLGALVTSAGYYISSRKLVK